MPELTDRPEPYDRVDFPDPVAMVSVHTSPFEQAGRANAGGLNVYVRRLAEELADRGVPVDIFTRRTDEVAEPATEIRPGLRLLTVLGSFASAGKHELGGHVAEFASAVLDHPDRADRYAVVHGHYWLAGLVGLRLREALGAPLVQSMHTLAAVKDAHRPPDAPREPALRYVGECDVVAGADRLIANTDEEAEALRRWYAADAARIVVAHPGADLVRFAPGPRSPARAALGLSECRPLVVFAGRLEPGKGIGVLLAALDLLGDKAPLLAVIGDYTTGSSGRAALEAPLSAAAGRGAVLRVPPLPQSALAEWFRAADAVCVPSYSESFGLVALEAQACGIPVIATDVGGLRTAVADGVSGVLIDGHDPRRWADAIARVAGDPHERDRLAAAAPGQAARFRWDRTADAVLDVYASVASSGATAGRRA